MIYPAKVDISNQMNPLVETAETIWQYRFGNGGCGRYSKTGPKVNVYVFYKSSIFIFKLWLANGFKGHYYTYVKEFVDIVNTDRWSTSFDFAWRLGHGIQCVCDPQTSCKIRNTGILFDKGDDWPTDDGLISIFSFLFGLARCFPNMLCFFWNIQRLFLLWSEEAQDHNIWSHLLRYIWLSHVIARDMRWL